jgi:hypothetical protein
MGGARWTLVSGIGLVGSIIYTIGGLVPDTSSAEALQAGFGRFLWGMLAIFLFAGIGNASTFKQMPRSSSGAAGASSLDRRYCGAQVPSARLTPRRLPPSTDRRCLRGAVHDHLSGMLARRPGELTGRVRAVRRLEHEASWLRYAARPGDARLPASGRGILRVPLSPPPTTEIARMVMWGCWRLELTEGGHTSYPVVGRRKGRT